MADWLIDKTDLIQIKHELLHEVRVGSAPLGLLGLGANNQYVSLIPGGITIFLPYEKKDANTGLMTRRFEILLIGSVTVQICKKVAALQMGSFVFKKQAEVPYDGVGTPQQWIFTTGYTGTGDVIAL